MKQFSECLFLFSTMQECGKKSKQDVDLFSNILYLAEFQTRGKKAFSKYISAYLATYTQPAITQLIGQGVAS